MEDFWFSDVWLQWKGNCQHKGRILIQKEWKLIQASRNLMTKAMNCHPNKDNLVRILSLSSIISKEMVKINVGFKLDENWSNRHEIWSQKQRNPILIKTMLIRSPSLISTISLQYTEWTQRLYNLRVHSLYCKGMEKMWSRNLRIPIPISSILI